MIKNKKKRVLSNEPDRSNFRGVADDRGKNLSKISSFKSWSEGRKEE